MRMTKGRIQSQFSPSRSDTALSSTFLAVPQGPKTAAARGLFVGLRHPRTMPAIRRRMKILNSSSTVATAAAKLGPTSITRTTP